MALYERAKKILANANYYNLAYFGHPDSIWRWQRCCAIYLYTFLIEKGICHEKDTSKATILVITIGFLVLYFVFSWKWAIITSLVVGLIGIFSNTLSRWIDWFWMKLAQILNAIVPKLLLGIVFFLFLLPISLLSRLFTKDPLMLSNKYKSCFTDVNEEIDKKYFERPW